MGPHAQIQSHMRICSSTNKMVCGGNVGLNRSVVQRKHTVVLGQL